MKPTKKQELEIMQVYDTWMNSYLNGDVKTYDSFLDDGYRFIGSTDNEEFLNRKDTTQFFKDTAEQFSGKTDLRKQTTTIEAFDDLIFITHLFDAWFINGTDWTYYGRFRFTSVLQEKKEGWKFIYQHFSIADSKTDEGETIGFDKVNEENQELREAVKRRTIELEEKNRELEVETSLEHIRAQAVAMQQSSDLLDIVVTMRNEFTKLGHEAHYFWHMMWLPETYEKAMTSGDGSKIGFVMTLPRHIHGDIPLLAKWEKSKKPTVVYAMTVKEAIDYVDKMVSLGDFQNIDPQAPSNNDLKHIGGLTFIMARTTHGEIGYSLPGIVKNPPKEDLDILVRFTGAFDLAHKRFLDLQKAETQARETQIELALEKVRSRTMAMQHSDELQETSFLLDQQVRELGIKTWGCAFNIYGEKESTEWFGNEKGILPTYTVPRAGIFKEYYKKGKKGETLFVQEFSGKACIDHYEYMSTLPVIGDVLKKLKETNNGFPTYQIDHVVYFKYGYLLFITKEHVPDAHDIFKRFAKVFEQTYTRFLDLQKAETQAKEAQIEAALERVRSQSMGMQTSKDLSKVTTEMFTQLRQFNGDLYATGIVFCDKHKGHIEQWHSVPNAGMMSPFIVPIDLDYIHQYRYDQWKKGTELFSIEIPSDFIDQHFNDIFKLPSAQVVLKEFEANKTPMPPTPSWEIDYGASFKHGYLLVSSLQPFKETEILPRFAKVFEQTYTRFLDLKKAEAQARESQIETALERVRSCSMAMHKSDELKEVVKVIFDQMAHLKINADHAGIVVDYEPKKDFHFWVADNQDIPARITVPYLDLPWDRKFTEAKKKGKDFFIMQLNFEEKNSFYKKLLPHIEGLTKEAEDFYLNCPGLAASTVLQKDIGLYIENFSCIPFSDEENSILMRFGKVFQQTYTRFLDLQKAEAQAREAQIENALEKVRSRTMAMQKGEELQDVVVLLYKELIALGVTNFATCGYVEINEETNRQETWVTSPGGDSLGLFYLPLTGDVHFNARYEAWKNKKTVFHQTVAGKERRKHLEYAITTFNSKEAEEMVLTQFPDPTVFYCFNFSHGYLHLVCGSQLNKDEESLLARFTRVFEQTYARFLDLKKAEAQAREAQIENALEKVRSRSLAMHKPDELQEVITVVAEKLQELGVIFDVGGVILCTYFPDNKDVVHWIASPDLSSSQSYLVPYFDNPIFSESWDSKNRGDAYFSKEFPVEAKNEFFKHAFEHSDYRHFPDDYKQHVLEAEKHNLSAAWSKNSAIIIPSLTGVVPSESDADIIKRFAKVFEQAYIRFMDLEKAEAQARESQIEAALEKVRSRTMAMQQSNELPEAANDLFLQVQALGIPAWSAGYCIWETKDKKAASCNMSSEGEIQKSFILPTIGEGYNFYDHLQKGETFYVEELGGDALVKHYDFMRTLPTVGEIFDELIDAGLSLPTFQIFHILYFPQGYLMFITYEQVPEAHEIFKRFAKVFEQTYTRFLDLQRAEAQAREATKQASLDRVRGQIASMRSTDDLNRITPLVWNELTIMGVPFIRCGVFIIDEPTEIVEVHLSAPDGNSLGALHLQFNTNPLTENTVSHWRKGSILKEHWNREEFISWTQSLIEQGQISDKNTYQGATDPPESLDLHFIPFTQGMLYVGSENPLNDKQIDLVQSLADAFAIAYARYEDFTKLEKAKESVETTLSELKATQNQLVQSEKMASLGELSAGIAHEIQNPLNFVNNFSEVSSELIEEMNEEIEKGDMEEAKAIANDVKQNLEKILHHGKRADGIVKGMLQHSRSSSGQKEPTDINALTDEYLRLAYHGLRAKDKSFNAKLETDYDENIGNINIIPQDIGRVILNLITNAFYVVDEKKKSGVENYEPTVGISTKKVDKNIEIKVNDNGNGIPKKVLAKIFQPFFTTKPTGQGTGLGLSMSYDIVTKGHGGELKVETKEGKETTFTVALPIG